MEDRVSVRPQTGTSHATGTGLTSDRSRRARKKKRSFNFATGTWCSNAYNLWVKSRCLRCTANS